MVLCTIPSNAESAREYFKFAKFSYDARDYVKALDYINKAIELEPDYTNGLMLRVEINKEFKNYHAMIPDANRIIIVDNQAISLLSQTHLLRGIAFFYTGNYEKASSDFKMAISMNSGIAEAYFYQGLIAYHYSSHFQALEFFDLAIQKEGNNSEYYFYRANLKMEYFQPLPNTPAFDHTMADIIKSIDLNPGDHRAYKLKCDMLKRNLTTARELYIEELTKTIELFPDQAEFYAQRGTAKILDHDFVAALVDLNKAISFDESNELIIRNRALCHHNLRHYRLAINDYTAALDLMIARYQQEQDKNYKKVLAETLVMRGRTYEQMTNPDNACTDFYNAAKLGSKIGLNNYRRSCNVFN
jgi:tetratricopeptide (TPR) repeat protein